jgi:hypothetical protein
MIKITIEIRSVPGGGVGVNVETEMPQDQPQGPGEGGTWAGLCVAINEYMRSHGVPKFDCLKSRS